MQVQDADYSEAYYLRTAVRADARDLLTRAGLRGFAFQPDSSRWAPTIAEGKPGAPNPDMIAANNGRLLYVVGVEGRGWHFSVYDGATGVSDYEINFGPGRFVVHKNRLNWDIISELLTEEDPNMPEDVYDDDSIARAFLVPASAADLEDTDLASRFLAMIGIGTFDGVNYKDLCNLYRTRRSTFDLKYPDAIFVDR